MLEVLTGAINNDTEVLSLNTGIRFPKHLTDEVCEFLIQGTGYFDFHGRGGLIKTLQQYVPKTHYLVGILKKPKYRASLDRLTALRNYAAHDSARARSGALKAVGNKKMASPGSWLKRRVGLGCWQKT